MKKNIKIILLLFLFLAIPKNVKAGSGYYDDDGNYYTLLFEDTPLKNFVTRDFALNYKYRDYTDSTDIAIIESTSNSGTYTFRKAFDKNKEILKVIYQIPDSLKETYGYQYVMYVYPDYVSGSKNAISPKIFENKILKRAVSGQHLVYQKQTVIRNRDNYSDAYDMLNFDINSIPESELMITTAANTGLSPNGNDVLIIAVKTDGQIEVFSDIKNRNSQKWLNTAMLDENTAPSKYLIYSSVDIYHINTGELLVKKEEFEIRSITSNYTITCDDDNPFIYNIQIMIQKLKNNDNVKIYKDNILIKDDIMEDPEENEYIQINDAESGLYKIEVYDESNELIHENNFNIEIKKEYEIEDSTEEKETINENDLIINENITNLIKNNFLQISKNENLYKIIITIFITSLIIIIKNKV